MLFVVLLVLVISFLGIYYTIKQTKDRNPADPVTPVVEPVAVVPTEVTPEQQAAEQTAQGTQSSSGPLS